MATMTAVDHVPTKRRFSVSESTHVKRRMSIALEKKTHFGPALTVGLMLSLKEPLRSVADLPLIQTLYLGLSAVFIDPSTVAIALSAHNTVYLLDYAVRHISLNEDDGGDEKSKDHDMLAERIVEGIRKYEHENFIKFLGAGLPTTLKQMSPRLCSKLWLDLDIVPIVMRPDDEHADDAASCFWDIKGVEEQADSMARKCIL